MTTKTPSAVAEATPLQPPPFACSHCSDCGYNNFPPADVCPKCWSVNMELKQLASDGILYSFSTIGSADTLQFVGYIDVLEKVRVFGLLNTKERPVCGMPVRISSVRAPGNGPCFVFDIFAQQEA